MSVVLPVRNNVGTLATLCARLRAALDGPLEIVVVDDGSTDGSREAAAALGVVVVARDVRGGQNAALLAGIARATGAVTCVMDADLQDPPEGIAHLVARLGRGDVSVAFSTREGPRPATSRAFRAAIHALYPNLPLAPCLCFAMVEDVRRALVARARPGDYLPAVIGVLRVPTAAVRIVRDERPSGRSAYSALGRLSYSSRMLRSALWLRLRAAAQRR